MVAAMVLAIVPFFLPVAFRALGLLTGLVLTGVIRPQPSTVGYVRLVVEGPWA